MGTLKLERKSVNLLERVINRASVLVREKKGLRNGQAHMIALGEENNALYNAITGGPNDCFYDDRKLPSFFQRITFFD